MDAAGLAEELRRVGAGSADERKQAAAIDQLYERVNPLLQEGAFGLVNDLFAELSERVCLEFRVAMLTITKPVPEDQVPLRQAYFEKTRRLLRTAGQDADRALKGL